MTKKLPDAGTHLTTVPAVVSPYNCTAPKKPPRGLVCLDAVCFSLRGSLYSPVPEREKYPLPGWLHKPQLVLYKSHLAVGGRSSGGGQTNGRKLLLWEQGRLPDYQGRGDNFYHPEELQYLQERGGAAYQVSRLRPLLDGVVEVAGRHLRSRGKATQKPLRVRLDHLEFCVDFEEIQTHEEELEEWKWEIKKQLAGIWKRNEWADDPDSYNFHLRVPPEWRHRKSSDENWVLKLYRKKPGWLRMEMSYRNLKLLDLDRLSYYQQKSEELLGGILGAELAIRPRHIIRKDRLLKLLHQHGVNRSSLTVDLRHRDLVEQLSYRGYYIRTRFRGEGKPRRSYYLNVDILNETLAKLLEPQKVRNAFPGGRQNSWVLRPEFRIEKPKCKTTEEY